MGPGHSEFSVSLICLYLAAFLVSLSTSVHSVLKGMKKKISLVMKSFMLYKSCERFRSSKREKPQSWLLPGDSAKTVSKLWLKEALQLSV